MPARPQHPALLAGEGDRRPGERPGLLLADRSFRYSRQQVRLVAPADDATVDVPTLRWDPVAGAEKYDVSVVSSTARPTVTNDLLDLVDADNTLNPADGPFEWTVQAIDHNSLATPLDHRRRPELPGHRQPAATRPPPPSCR